MKILITLAMSRFFLVDLLCCNKKLRDTHETITFQCFFTFIFGSLLILCTKIFACCNASSVAATGKAMFNFAEVEWNSPVPVEYPVNLGLNICQLIEYLAIIKNRFFIINGITLRWIGKNKYIFFFYLIFYYIYA